MTEFIFLGELFLQVLAENVSSVTFWKLRWFLQFRWISLSIRTININIGTSGVSLGRDYLFDDQWQGMWWGGFWKPSHFTSNYILQFPILRFQGSSLVSMTPIMVHHVNKCAGAGLLHPSIQPWAMHLQQWESPPIASLSHTQHLCDSLTCFDVRHTNYRTNGG